MSFGGCFLFRCLWAKSRPTDCGNIKTAGQNPGICFKFSGGQRFPAPGCAAKLFRRSMAGRIFIRQHPVFRGYETVMDLLF
jgi:hypothetical protein